VPVAEAATPEPALVVVSGVPRSGTSWVARTLAYAPGLTYYREPDNHDYVEGARFRFRFLYLPRPREDPEYAAHMRRALTGQIVTPATMRDDPGPLLGRLPARWARRLGSRFPVLYLRAPGVLAKLVFSNLALEWISDAFPRARQVHVLRHPCGTFASWRRLGWEPRPHLLLEDELLTEELGPLAAVLAEADGFWERAAAEWAATAVIVTRQAARHPDWLVVQHEWLCEDPEPRFRLLTEAAGLRWTDGAARFLRGADAPGDDPFGFRRRSRDEIDKWRREVDPADVARCRAVVERFELPWYPGFEPVPSAPTWAN
jgi:hypothetical protein